MNLKELLSPTITLSADVDYPIAGLTSDSRAVQPGYLFAAMPGVAGDGRDYIEQAIQAGAVAVLYDPKNASHLINQKTPCIPIENLSHQLGHIAARFYDYPTAQIPTIGITGTNGKTSISHYLAQAFALAGRKSAVLGTVGNGFLPNLKKTAFTTLNAIELQEMLAGLRKEKADVFVMEASSHGLDQGRLVGVEFNTAVFTQLSRDHLDYHGDMERYKQAKMRLFEWDGLQDAVINIDDPVGREITAKIKNRVRVHHYGIDNNDGFSDSFIHATAIIPKENGFAVAVHSSFGDGEFETSLLGRFNVSNVLATLMVLLIHDVSFQNALLILSQLKPVTGRMQSMGGDDQPTVVVDYAHTPDALEKALSALKEHCNGQLICVFGCGGDRDPGKRPMMAAVAERLADHIVITNDNPRRESPQKIIDEILAGLNHQSGRVSVEMDREKAIEKALSMADKNDMILVAGKGHETVQILGDETIPFSDIEIVTNHLKK